MKTNYEIKRYPAQVQLWGNNEIIDTVKTDGQAGEHTRQEWREGLPESIPMEAVEMVLDAIGNSANGMFKEDADDMKKDYCTQDDGDCLTCSLVNYGRDCMNNPVAAADDNMEKKKLAELVAEYVKKNPIPYDAIDLISRIMQDRPISDGQKRLIAKIQSA